MMLLIIFLIAVVLYSVRIAFFLYGAFIERKMTKAENSSYIPFVTVVVPARNEENNIKNCIESIAQSTYPKDKYEILIVDDRSNDRTSEIANQLKSEFSNLRVVNITEDNRNKNLKGKAGALDFGFNNAFGEILLLTDADCKVNPKWIESIVNSYSDKNVKIGAAYTITSSNTIFDKFQALEWITMCIMGSAGVALNNSLGCFGNNMSIRKETYFEVGGYEKINFSITEDLALLREVMSKGHKARFICSYETSIKTLPVETIKDYLKQHHRWARGGMGLGWYAVFFVISSLSVWLTAIISLIQGSLIGFGLILLFKILCDFLLIVYPTKTLKEGKLLYWFFPASFFFLLVELIVPFLVLRKKIIWKDQVFK
jgi:cellulose synthase/poly-beta-1,6-N-acetylglucosamine synthase-like glycosyltransferase